MRTVFFVSLFLAACGGGGGLSSNGDLAGRDLAHTSSVDLAGGDFSSVDQGLTIPSPDFAGDDLSGRVCFSSGACTEPNCGTSCCADGEWCDNGTCRCGTTGACTAGNICASGAITPNSHCGTICCGKTAACPG